VSVDRSQSSFGQHLELTGRFYHVKRVMGSNYSDYIVGNEKPHVLNGGIMVTDYLEGKNGTDAYIVEDGSRLAVVNNFADDNKEDLVIIDGLYESIEVSHLTPIGVGTFKTGSNGSMWSSL
jgi:hypothetical protein